MCPNWCNNNLTISHKDPAMMERFKKASKTGIMEEFFPTPQELKDTVSSPGTDNKELQEKYAANLKKYGAESWYDWNVANWGTKWDFASEDCDNVDDNTLFCYFDTAWGPPIEGYKKLNELGYSIEASYIETGCAFAGRYVDGEEEYVDYDFEDENWREGLSDELAEMLECEYDSFLSWKEYEKEQTNETE